MPSGYRIPAGSLVRFSQFAVSRDPRWYPEPERFDPERFSPEAEARRPRWSYFPFGGGARVCIGEHFATIESMIALASIVQDFDLELVPGHPIEFFASISMRPKHGIRMTARRRVRSEN